MSKNDSSPPKFGVKPPKFSCPLSPTIMWHHDLIYKECPLCIGERDMISCEKCQLKKVTKVITRPKKKSKSEVLPKIGKTYSS